MMRTVKEFREVFLPGVSFADKLDLETFTYTSAKRATIIAHDDELLSNIVMIYHANVIDYLDQTAVSPVLLWFSARFVVNGLSQNSSLDRLLWARENSVAGICTTNASTVIHFQYEVDAINYRLQFPEVGSNPY